MAKDKQGFWPSRPDDPVAGDPRMLLDKLVICKSLIILALVPLAFQGVACGMPCRGTPVPHLPVYGVGSLILSIAGIALVHRARRDAISIIPEMEGPTIDQAKRPACREGKTVPLTPNEYDLLLLMVHHAGRVMTTRRALLTTVRRPAPWDDLHHLPVFMGQFRLKIERGPSQPRILHIDPHMGYRMPGGIDVEFKPSMACHLRQSIMSGVDWAPSAPSLLSKTASNRQMQTKTVQNTEAGPLREAWMRQQASPARGCSSMRLCLPMTEAYQARPIG